MLSPENITLSYSFKNLVLNKNDHLSFKCLNHFLNISLDTEIIFHLNHSFLRSKLHLLKKPEAKSVSNAFAIIRINLSQPHLYKNVSCNIIILFLSFILIHLIYLKLV